MDRIAEADRILSLLRERLLERARAAKSSGRQPSAKQDAAGGGVASSIDVVAALAAVDGADDRQLGRALIQSLLAEHFGSQMINDAKFQTVVDRVHQALLQDSEADRLLSRMIANLREAAAREASAEPRAARLPPPRR